VQTNDGVSRTSGNTYNLAGYLIEQAYPSGRVVKNTLDRDGSLLRIQSKANASQGFYSYADSMTYLASGQLNSMQLGNGYWETRKFNSRLQPTEITLGTTANSDNLWKINYEFGELQGNGAVNTAKNNGSVGKQTITVPTMGSVNRFTAVQTFTFDSLKRLKSSLEKIGVHEIWKQAYTYDRFGNRKFDPNNTTCPVSCTTAVCNPDFNASNNRYAANQNYEYDSNGNVTKNAEGARFVYNALNKLVEVRDAATNHVITRNFYDGSGLRIKTETNNVFTTYTYDAFGKLIAEYVLNGPSNPSPAVKYLTIDMLGTLRVSTAAFGGIVARNDYMPFGEEIGAGMGSRTTGQKYSATDTTRQKFTGQIRDEEAKLDFFNARHYAFSLGRFTSPDSFGGKLSNPQTLNLYAYALNNPLKWVDPTGHFVDDPDTYYTDGNNILLDSHKRRYKLRKETVNVHCFCSDDRFSASGNTPPSAFPPPELPQSLQDWVPVWGSLREFAYYYNCHGGGCNITRSTGAFIQLAMDLSPLGTAAREWSIARNALVREVVGETTEVGVTSTIRANKAAGDAFEEVAGKRIDDVFDEFGEQVTLKTQDGTRTRMDFLARDSEGTVFCIECKSSGNASLTRNQSQAFPSIVENGATIVGKGKPGFPGGTQLPPNTPLMIIRKE
jgi:RHS repeat-associated protein